MTKRRPPDRQTILIADDSEIKRAIPADMLGKECEIIEAANGMRALETSRERNIEINQMLMDIIMPDLVGFKLLQALIRWRWIVSIPVIMIAAERGNPIVQPAHVVGVSLALLHI